MKKAWTFVIVVIVFSILVFGNANAIPNFIIENSTSASLFNVSQSGIFGEYFVGGFKNITGDTEWIMTEHIADVDKEDVEGDENTFVDITGDNMTGTLSVPQININNQSNTKIYNNATCVIISGATSDLYIC